MDNYDEQPDVEWSCVEFQGMPLLVVQTTGAALSAALLARDYEKIEVRFTFDNDRLPDLVVDKFICFTDGEFMHPVLACDPDPLLDPLRAAITAKAPWLFAVQVMIEGARHMRLFKVDPDGNATAICGPDGEAVVPRWMVGIV